MNRVLVKSRILLPSNEIDKTRWSCIACDQYASQPEYWRKVESLVGKSPSTLRLMLPEAYLSESKTYIPKIHAAMNQYIRSDLLAPAVDGFVLVERETSCGTRVGVVGAVDLEAFDYFSRSASAIRATEGTIAECLSPRLLIRSGAPIELPHAMLLFNDPGKTIVESLYARRQALRPLYDFDLMMDAGHIRGWAVEDADADAFLRAADSLSIGFSNPQYLVGDGNHSLAAAKRHWESIRAALPPKAREGHPARYALVELANIASPAIEFEPIYRLITGVNPIQLITGFRQRLKTLGIPDVAGNDLTVITRAAHLSFGFDRHPLPVLDAFLDDFVAAHPPARVEYIHGAETLSNLIDNRADAMGFLPRAFSKAELFPTIRRLGALPKKTFSMGEASDKRFYLEAHSLV